MILVEQLKTRQKRYKARTVQITARNIDTAPIRLAELESATANIRWPWPLGKVSTAPGGVSVNFGSSAGPECDPRCNYITGRTIDGDEDGPTCYAARLEGFRPAVKKSHAEREKHPTRIANAATLALRGIRNAGIVIPWIRISSLGPVPTPETARTTAGFIAAFTMLMEEIAEHVKNGSGFHFPAETPEKRRFYTATIPQEMRGRMIVRESVQTRRQWRERRGPVSVVAGKPGQSWEQKLKRAAELQEERKTKTGRLSIICPKTLKTSHCGQCTACAAESCDVIYLSH